MKEAAQELPREPIDDLALPARKLDLALVLAARTVLRERLGPRLLALDTRTQTSRFAGSTRTDGGARSSHRDSTLHEAGYPPSHVTPAGHVRGGGARHPSPR